MSRTLKQDDGDKLCSGEIACRLKGCRLYTIQAGPSGADNRLDVQVIDFGGQHKLH